MPQLLLFPDARPLVERLGRDFFRGLPEGPGVYLMRGAGDALLYVGKAKNLRRRLGAYRVANPDRMARRHLRLVRAVERIEIEECADEPAALAREANLLREWRPRFNRAGTWSGPPQYLLWKLGAGGLELAVGGKPDADWNAHGPCGSAARHLRRCILRLTWLALNPQSGSAGLPAGWFRGHHAETARLALSTSSAAAPLAALFAGRAEDYAAWVLEQTGCGMAPFDLALIAEDIEYLTESFAG